MSTILKYAPQALKYAGGKVTVNLRHSTTDIYLGAAVNERTASPTFIAKTRNSVLDAVHTALQSGSQRAQLMLQKNLPHYSPVAAAAFNSAAYLTAKLRTTSAMQKVEAVPQALAASVGGFAAGLGQQAAALGYELVPITLRGVLAHPQMAEQLSRVTFGASAAITDPVRELRQSHQRVSEGLHTLMTQPMNVAQQAWATYQTNVLSNPIKTPDDVFIGVKTAMDAALLVGPARALGSVGTRAAAQSGAASGRTIDLSPQEYSVVREGQQTSTPQTQSIAPQSMALKAAQPDVHVLHRGVPLPVEPVWSVAAENNNRLMPARLDQIERGFQFTHVTAHQVHPARVLENHVADNPTYLEFKEGKETKVFEVGRPLKPYELVQRDDDRFLVFHENDGLRAPEGMYYFMRFQEKKGYVTYLDRSHPSVGALNSFFTHWSGPTEMGSVGFSAGSVVHLRIQSPSTQFPVPPRALNHPHANLGGWFSLWNGFHPNRSPSLGDYITVDELLYSKETLVPGRDGVRVDREMRSEEINQLARKLGGVEVHLMLADGNYYVLSGNSRTAPSLDRQKYKRFFSLAHNHLNGKFDPSLPDLKVAKNFYLHTLKSFPFARLHPSTRVVVNRHDDVVYARHFGPERGKFNPQVFNSDALGLRNAPEVHVSVRPRGAGKGIFRIEVGANFSAADGKEIRQSLIELAKKEGFETVTFEVELGRHPSERLGDLILQLQDNRLIFSMQEARYNFDSGNYVNNDKIFVWHENIRDPSKQVSNADVWHDQ